jgi:hypothetical protein
MVSFGNLRPMNSTNNKLLLYYDPMIPSRVGIDERPPEDHNAQWNGDALPPGNAYLIHTGPNTQGALYLTMADDKPNQETYMEKWLGGNSQYSPRQLWIPGFFDGPQRIFVTLNGNILQAADPNVSSSVIVGAYPEHNTDNPKPKTPGQIWLCSTTI